MLKNLQEKLIHHFPSAVIVEYEDHLKVYGEIPHYDTGIYLKVNEDCSYVLSCFYETSYMADIMHLDEQLEFLVPVAQFIENFHTDLELTRPDSYLDFIHHVTNLLRKVDTSKVFFNNYYILSNYNLHQYYNDWKKVSDDCTGSQVNLLWETYGIKGPLRDAVKHIAEIDSVFKIDNTLLDQLTLERRIKGW